VPAKVMANVAEMAAAFERASSEEAQIKVTIAPPATISASAIKWVIGDRASFTVPCASPMVVGRPVGVCDGPAPPGVSAAGFVVAGGVAVAALGEADSVGPASSS
jgi:hypothetical protein